MPTLLKSQLQVQNYAFKCEYLRSSRAEKRNSARSEILRSGRFCSRLHSINHSLWVVSGVKP